MGSSCEPSCSCLSTMLTLALCFFALILSCGAEVAVEVGGCSGNNTCPEVCPNGTCIQAIPRCLDNNGTCAESRQDPLSCTSENNCTVPANGTSRLFPSITVAGNGTFEKPLSTTAQFSPSPFLGVIPEQHGSLVIGEVFQDSVGPRHNTFAFPNRPVQEYAHSRDTHRDYQKPSVEIHVSPETTGYDRPDYDSSGRPYGKPEVDITVPTGYGRPDVMDYRPDVELKPANKPHLGQDNLGPKDYPNSVDFSGYPDRRPKPHFYEGYENTKNLLKPGKSLPPYQFEPHYSLPEKPIHEDNGEVNHYNLAYPPAGADASPGQYNHYIAEHGKGGSSSKWKSVLRFVTTVLPFGLLLAALSPNILVISPVDDSGSTTKNNGQRSLPTTTNPVLGPCGLRKLCEALSTSPQDYEIFLKAAQQGSTPELQDIIKKAKEKNCSSLGCLELKPTESTIR